MDIFKFDIATNDMMAMGKLDRNKQYTPLSALAYVMHTSKLLAKKFLIFFFQKFRNTGKDKVKGVLSTMMCY